MIRLSIVLAAYNVENYVQACLDSILKAVSAQCEIIIVLGRSKDRTNEICMSYAKKAHQQDAAKGKHAAWKDAAEEKYAAWQGAVKVRCILQDGCGLSNARNCGIRAAKGEYITFMDADDSVDAKDFAGFCLFLERICKKRGFDMLVNDFYSAGADGRVLLENRQIAAPKECVFGASYAVRLVRSRGTFWNAWRYVYRYSYLVEKGRMFAEGRTCEDLDFAVRSLLDGPDVLFCHMPFYKYCPLRPGSLMHVKNSAMVQDFLDIVRELLAAAGQNLCREDGRTAAQSGICCRKQKVQRELAAGMEEKLKELMILTLPDLYELSRRDRGKAVRGYRELFLESSLPERALIRAAFILCRTRCLKIVSFVLWVMRKARRKVRYRSRPCRKNFGRADEKRRKIRTNADYENTVPRQLLRRRERHGGIL